MSETIQLLSGITSLICAMLISAVVLNRHVHEGPILKFGLILMAGGLFASGIITIKGFDTMHGLWNASLLFRFGLLIVLLRVVWRLHQYKEKP